jgi:hypothetical protein
MGANAIYAADVGSKEKLERAGITGVGRDVPPDLWGDAPHQYTASRPDIVLYKPPQQGTAGAVHIVEIKYGRDTALNDTEMIAQRQHWDLYCRLQQARRDCTVTYHAITLGVGGTIPDTTIHHLRTLGLYENLLNRTCKRLHKHAVRHLRNLTEYRRMSIRKHRKKTPPGVT